MADNGRTPVSIAVSPSNALYVACDDGTVWTLALGAPGQAGTTSWRQVSNPIPGTKAGPPGEEKEG